ncbi:MAG TPA: hypothetical protein VHT27_08320 [Solirubrobacteraceae bacterium]|jgi:hypothetical protein|nr:hypothetical protein [Solirubrobacteraceae bacterium]
MPGTVVIPWYATGFRADAFQDALGELAAAAMRYGATSYAVYRARDDRYKFQQFAAFEEYLDWERYWESTEMVYFRAAHSSWYQVPVLYGWWDQTAGGALETDEPVPANGHGNGTWGPTGESA